MKEKLLRRRTGGVVTLNTGLTAQANPDYTAGYRRRLAMLRAGQVYREDPEQLDKTRHRLEHPGPLARGRQFLSRCCRGIYRRIRRK